MNIITATNTYNTAKASAAAGNHFEAAQLFLAAQRQAMICRSAQRQFIFDYAHAGSSLQAIKVLETSEDQAARSEAGRIRAESAFLFQRGI